MNTNHFTTDRVNNFTDAIFAIAITLLILDIRYQPLFGRATRRSKGSFQQPDGSDHWIGSDFFCFSSFLEGAPAIG